MLEPFSPLTRGQYPIFNKYPKFVVDYQVNWELCKILREKCLFSGVKSTDPSHENSKQPIKDSTYKGGKGKRAWYRGQQRSRISVKHSRAKTFDFLLESKCNVKERSLFQTVSMCCVKLSIPIVNTDPVSGERRLSFDFLFTHGIFMRIVKLSSTV